MAEWHVALCWAGQERVGFDNLIESGFSVFWPRWMETFKVLGRVREAPRSLAPGYLFVDFDGSDAELWHRVRELVGQTFGGYIGGEFPTRVPDEAFGPIFALGADATGLMPLPAEQRIEQPFRAGDKVRVLGALDGASDGTVTWADRRGVRFVTTMFLRQTECYLSVAQAVRMLEKVINENKHLAKQYGRGSKKHLRAAQKELYST